MSRIKNLSRLLILLPVFAFILSLGISVYAEDKAESWTATKAWEKFENGPPADPNFFPLIVWLQKPENAEKYKAAGINTYFGLWQGPKPGQIEALKAAGMYLICDMNPEALKHRNDKTIIGWMMVDEPDNFQFKTNLKVGGKEWRYGPSTLRVSMKDIGEMYETIKKEDPTRPVWLCFSRGVADDKYLGRGYGWENSMYPEYMRSCDVVGFDVYPVSNIGGEYLWYHAKGLDRIKEWAGAQKPRFNCIGPDYAGKKGRPTPEQIKAEIWISIIHGTKGIVYFCHNFKPKFQADALLQDPVMLAAVTKINTQITALAPVINSPDIDGVEVSSSNKAVPVDILVKGYNGEVYIFAAAMKMGKPTVATFHVKGVSVAEKVEVLEEDRTLDMDAAGVFKDEFKTWETHNYRVIKH